MSAIIDIIGREILDSRGFPSIECDILIESGIIGRASSPAGASIGSYEAIDLRDEDINRYNGKGVLKAVNYINTEISKAIKGIDVSEQTLLDRTLINLDGTDNKSRLGSNTLLAVSMAAAKAAANELNLPLYRYFGGLGTMKMPVPMINIINGGVHANNNLNIQEFMILPVSQKTFKEALRCGVEIFHALKKILLSKKISTSVGDEGGFSPNFSSNKECLSTIVCAVEDAGYSIRDDVLFAIDCASNEFYKNKKYKLANEKLLLSSNEFIDYLSMLVDEFPIISIEDAMHENDLEGWKLLSKKLGNKIQIVGDDLFATNFFLLKQAIEQKISNSILIKINQIGTLTEAFSVIDLAKTSKYTAIISHRSGETENTIISDIAVGLNTGQIKVGSVSRSDRTSKYNQLLRIEEDLGDFAIYPGKSVFYNLK